jgi:hypothetical protein
MCYQLPQSAQYPEDPQQSDSYKDDQLQCNICLEMSGERGNVCGLVVVKRNVNFGLTFYVKGKSARRT